MPDGAVKGMICLVHGIGEAFVCSNTVLGSKRVCRERASPAPLPNARVLATVHHGDDDDRVGVNAVQDDVWEAFDEASTEIAVDEGVTLGSLGDPGKGEIQMSSKLAAESGLAALIEVERFQKASARASGRKTSDFHRPAGTISSRTVAHGMPVGPSRSSLSRRRSSSARVSGVRTSSSGFTLCQSWSISSSFSSAVRPDRSTAGFATTKSLQHPLGKCHRPGRKRDKPAGLPNSERFVGDEQEGA
jgi:hypothetical protein